MNMIIISQERSVVCHGYWQWLSAFSTNYHGFLVGKGVADQCEPIRHVVAHALFFPEVVALRNGLDESVVDTTVRLFYHHELSEGWHSELAEGMLLELKCEQVRPFGNGVYLWLLIGEGKLI